MKKICRLVAGIFGALWLIALALFLIGTLGLFGQPVDPLSGVFLIPLGLPWNRLMDLLPEPVWPAAAALAPGVNLALLILICRMRAR